MDSFPGRVCSSSSQCTRGGSSKRSSSAPAMGQVDLEERFQGLRRNILVQYFLFFDKNQFHWIIRYFSTIFLQIR